MIQARSKTLVNGLKVKVAPFPAKTAFKLQYELFKLLGPMVGSAIGAFKGLGAMAAGKGSGLDGLEIDGGALGNTLQSFFGAMNPDDYLGLVERLLACTIIDVEVEPGKLVTLGFTDGKFDTSFNIAFQGELMSVFIVIGFVLEVNYPDFFGKLAGIGQKLRAMASSLPDAASEGKA